jgi:hypothetical protein
MLVFTNRCAGARLAHQLEKEIPMALRRLALAAALSLFAASGLAQDDPGLSARFPSPSNAIAPNGYGLNSQVTYVSSAEFSPQSGTEVWSYQGFNYYAISGGTGIGVVAPLKLENGAVVTGMTCNMYDASAAGGSVSLFKNTYDRVTNGRNNIIVATVVTSGNSGYQDPSAALNFTARTEEGDLDVFYWLRAVMPNGDVDVQLRGCKVTWNRQVSLAPLTATFGDVPTSHPFHRFIEALVASGITAGCGGGNFCPNNPVTRGEMAVFLSAALGLHYPN